MAQAEFDEMNGGTKKFVTLHNVFRFDEDDGLRHRLLGLSAAGAPPGTSDLRRLDVLLWMLGKKRPHEVFGPGQQR